MDLQIADKTALISGSTAGIGWRSARCLDAADGTTTDGRPASQRNDFMDLRRRTLWKRYEDVRLSIENEKII
jgi:NAD(P)-dependent dehydrogenase (short-subunit alcohol dehydrogenase family)